VHVAKLNILIPESHRLELTLPADLPSGPAELTVVVAPARGEGARARAMGMDAGTASTSEHAAFIAPAKVTGRLPSKVARSG
jgi:hypothetical protein